MKEKHIKVGRVKVRKYSEPEWELLGRGECERELGNFGEVDFRQGNIQAVEKIQAS